MLRLDLFIFVIYIILGIYILQALKAMLTAYILGVYFCLYGHYHSFGFWAISFINLLG